MKELTYCLPEEEGVSSIGILDCLKFLEEEMIPLHSFMLIRHGKVVFETYYKPVEKYMLHRLYSSTKTFTAVAIGCLAEEGKLKLNDPITMYFPEYLPEKVPQWLMDTTIRDMLEMRSCHSATTYHTDITKNWVESFFKVKPDHAPGTVFSYDTSSSHTLCALAEKLSGKKMLDYLRDVCLDKIGFSKEAYICEDPFGVSWGGSGLMATTEDFARFAMLLMNEGRWEGEQLIPKWFIKEATDGHVPNLIHGDTPDYVSGYGYQIWKLREGFCCFGKGSQLALCIPRRDLICITTADTTGIAGGSQQIISSIFRYIISTLDQGQKGSLIPSGEWTKERRLAVMEQKTERAGTREKEVDKVVYEMEGGSGFFRKVSVEFETKQGHFRYETPSGNHSVSFGFHTFFTGQFPVYDQYYAASGAWLDKDSLCITVHILGLETSHIRIQMAFKDDKLTLHMVNTGELYFKEYAGWFAGTKKV